MEKRSDNDPQFEISFYENILKNSPNFIEALTALGDLYTRQGFYQKGLEIDRRLAKLRPDDAIVQYNLACSYSLMGEIAQAREVMRLAFDLGYDDIEHLEKDPDLLNLLTDVEFAEFIKKARARISRKVRRQAEEGV